MTIAANNQWLYVRFSVKHTTVTIIQWNDKDTACTHRLPLLRETHQHHGDHAYHHDTDISVTRGHAH